MKQRLEPLLARRVAVLASLFAAAAIATPALALGSQARGLARTAHRAVYPASFGYLPKGWSIFSDAVDVLSDNGASASASALSWRYTPSENGPAGALPRNGVMVWVHLFRAAADPARVNLCATTPQIAGYPPRSLPLALPRTTTLTLDGSPQVKEYRIFGRYRDDYDFDVRVDLAPRAQTSASWRLAARVVAAIRFPTWPTAATCS